MKKLFLIFITILLCVSVSGCLEEKNDKNSSTAVSSSTDSTGDGNDSKLNSASEKGTVSEVKQQKLDEAGIRTLVKENINCVQNIFVSGSLPTYGPALKENIYQVEMTTYKNYAEFEKYVRSVYSSETADMLLKDYPYEGDPKYINADGKLCINMDKSGAKGYFVDWSDYKVNITKLDGNTCEFTLTATKQEPGDNTPKEDYKVSAVAVLENGKWLLSKIIY